MCAPRGGASELEVLWVEQRVDEVDGDGAGDAAAEDEIEHGRPHMFAAQRARDISAGAQITVDRDRDKNPVVALREIAETKLDQAQLRDSLISGMQKHADIDKPEEVNEMAELEQELAAALAQGGAEAAQPKALPMAEEEDIPE